MPADSDFDQALQLAQVLQEPEWTDYTHYLTLRGKGLRKPALKKLNEFMRDAQTWAFTDRWHFTSSLLHALRCFQTRSIPLPQPLVKQVLRPTLLEARNAFPKDPHPPYWLAMEGIYSWSSDQAFNQQEVWLKEAIARDPTFQAPRLTLVNNILSSVAWHQHELPWGYLGVPAEDLQALYEVKSLLQEAELTPFSRQLGVERDALERTAQQFVTYKNSGESFYRDWCDKNSLSYTYEEKPE